MPSPSDPLPPPDQAKEVHPIPTAGGLKENIKDNLSFLAMGALGCIGLYLLTITVGEAYATAVGPDFLIKLPAVFVRLALILWLRRIIMVFVFPTILVFSRKGSSPQSEFRKRWDMGDGAYDPRISIAIFTYMGSLFIATLIVLFAL